MSVLDEARELLSTRLADLDEERVRLERALKELGGEVSARKPGRPKGSKASSTANGRRGRKRGGENLQTQLLRYLKSNPSASGKEVAAALGKSEAHANKLMSDARKAGVLSRGPNREFVVTEDGGGAAGSSEATAPPANGGTSKSEDKPPEAPKAKSKSPRKRRGGKRKGSTKAGGGGKKAAAEKQAPAAPGSDTPAS